jgi:hypothetical protein
MTCAGDVLDAIPQGEAKAPSLNGVNDLHAALLMVVVGVIHVGGGWLISGEVNTV